MDSKVYLLTVSTALGPERLRLKLPVYQPSWEDQKEGNENNQIAQVYQWVGGEDPPGRPVGVLAALDPAIENGQWSPQVIGFGALTGPAEAGIGDKVYTVGRFSVLQTGKVIGRAQWSIPGAAAKDAQEVLLIQVVTDAAKAGAVAFSQKGDIGAPVLTPDGKLVGVVVAQGKEAGRDVTFALPIGPLLDALNVNLAVQSQPPRSKS
jgi:hypothetical protein